jgi:GNAT superfamily N-acetyltransferase
MTTAGVARFIRLSATCDVAEGAVAVVDHMQRRGIGRLLLHALAVVACERGLSAFHVEVLQANVAVAALLHELDADARPICSDGSTAVYEIALSGVLCDQPVSGPRSVVRLADGHAA